MRYSNVREIKNPVQHEIEDIASAWVWGQHHLLFPRCKSVSLNPEYTKGPPRLFGWLQFQEITQVFWSGGGLFGILLAWTQCKTSIRGRWEALSALLLGNARSGGGFQGAKGRAAHPRTCAGGLNQSAVLKGWQDTFVRPSTSIMWLHGLNVDGALIYQSTSSIWPWLSVQHWEAAITSASSIGGNGARQPWMAWGHPIGNSWQQLWVTIKPRVCQGSASVDWPF